MDYNQFTINEIRQIQKDYPLLRGVSGSHVTAMYNKIQEDYFLTEFELQTININKTIETLKTRFKNSIIDTFPSRDHKRILQIVISANNIKSTLKEINDFMNSFGWFLSLINNKKYPDISIVKPDEKGRVLLQYEEKIGEELKPNQTYMYHMCTNLNLINIEYAGLTPKTQSKIANHPARIYMFQFLPEEEQLKNIMKRMYINLEPERQSRVHTYFLLQIEYNKIKDQIKIYKDPNMPYAVYTTANIKPQYIKEINKYPITK